MRKPLRLKTPVPSIAKATLLLLNVQRSNQCVPDFLLHEVCITTGLIDKEAREVRDLIQSQDFEHLWKPSSQI